MIAEKNNRKTLNKNMPFNIHVFCRITDRQTEKNVSWIADEKFKFIFSYGRTLLNFRVVLPLNKKFVNAYLKTGHKFGSKISLLIKDLCTCLFLQSKSANVYLRITNASETRITTFIRKNWQQIKHRKIKHLSFKN